MLQRIPVRRVVDIGFRLSISAASFALTSLIVVLAANIPKQSLGAPHPAAAGSRMITPKMGFFRSPDGLRLHSGESGWIQTARPEEKSSIQTAYRSPEFNSKASLTLRVDRLERKTTLEKYYQRWSKDFAKFGFDVLQHKPYVLSGRNAIAIDLMNRDAKIQLRQVLIASADGMKIALFTCRDRPEKFKDTVQACDSILNTVSW